MTVLIGALKWRSLVACMVCSCLVTGAIVTLSGTSAFAQSADASKLAQIETLYKASGTEGRIDAQLQIFIIVMSHEIKSSLAKRLLEVGYSEQQSDEIAEAKAQAYKVKMRESILPLLREAVVTYSVAADQNLTQQDVDFLRNFYLSDAGKAYVESTPKIVASTNKPLQEEFQAYLAKAKSEVVSGKPASPFHPKDYSAALATIKPERVALIKSTIDAGKVIEGFSSTMKEAMTVVTENAPDEQAKKSVRAVLDRFDYAAAYMPLLILAYDKTFSDPQLNTIREFLVDSRSQEIGKHLASTEVDIQESLGAKIDKLSTKTYAALMADLTGTQKSAGGK